MRKRNTSDKQTIWSWYGPPYVYIGIFAGQSTNQLLPVAQQNCLLTGPDHHFELGNALTILAHLIYLTKGVSHYPREGFLFHT